MLKINPALRRTLTSIYHDVSRIEPISDDLEIDHSRIAWNKAANEVWYQVIRECMVLDLIPDLISNVRSEYKTNRTLRDIDNAVNKLASELEQALKKSGLDTEKIGLIDTVNCGREKESNEFWDPKVLDPKKTPLLTGLISGLDTQSPKSLAERLVYEYLNVMETETQAVYYQRDPRDFGIKSLEIDAKTPDNLNRLLDKYLEGVGLIKGLSKFSAIAHIIEVDIGASANVLEDITATAIEKFTAFGKKKKVFNLLTIVFKYTGEMDISSTDKQLQKVAEGSTEIKYYRNLKEASEKDITSWFSSNDATYAEGVNAFIEEFIEMELDRDTKKAFQSSHSLSMDKMLKIQKQVFEYAMKKDNTNKSPEDVK